MKTRTPRLSMRARGAASVNSAAVSVAKPAFPMLAGFLVMALPAMCRGPALAATTPAASPGLSSSAEQQKRLDAMKAKGPQASLTILPVMLVGRPFDQVTDVLGVLLEREGLQHLELGRTPFTAGVKTEVRVLSVSLTRFLRTNSIATDYALYAEINGPSLDEVRAVVMDKAGEIVWADRQTTKDKAFQALATPRDPMILLVFLVERLRPQFGLNDDTATKRSHTLEGRLTAKRSYAPAAETESSMPARRRTMKLSRAKAGLMVLGVRTAGRVSAPNGNDLAKRIGETKLFRRATVAKSPVLLETRRTDRDQMSYLWAIARDLQAHVKANHPDADYVLYADYQFNPQHWEQGGVQFVVCDRQGELVLAELTNSSQEDYQRVRPISVEGCDKLLVERLTGCLR